MPQDYDGQLFIKISNEFFDGQNEQSMTSKIGHVGFTIFSCILIEKGSKSHALLTIKNIKAITCITDTRTIVKYIKLLMYNKLISIDDITIDSKIKINDNLLIHINPEWSEPEKFTIMSEELFMNKIQLIKPIGWTLLCVLSKLHNYTYGTLDSEHNLFYTGYASPSEESLMYYVSVSSKSTINEYINILENLQLIFVIRNDRVDVFGNENEPYSFKRVNNKYIVNNRIPKNRYFLNALQAKYDKELKYKMSKF